MADQATVALAEPGLWEADFHAWTEQQAAVLREGRLDALDAEHLAAEIAGMARAIETDMRSRFAVLLHHLLRWQYQEGLRGRAWKYGIEEQRNALRKLLDESPSLHEMHEQLMFEAYQDATIQAALETGYLPDVFPSSSPFSFAQAMDDAFWPELD